MMRLRRVAALVVLTAPLLVAAGCQQGVGDRCQVQSDCQDNLICVLPAGGTPQGGGTCEPTNVLIGDMASDGGASVDLSGTVTSTDLLAPPQD